MEHKLLSIRKLFKNSRTAYRKKTNKNKFLLYADALVNSAKCFEYHQSRVFDKLVQTSDQKEIVE